MVLKVLMVLTVANLLRSTKQMLGRTSDTITLDREKYKHNSTSQYLIKDEAFWGRKKNTVCLHYYCSGASLFAQAGFHHT